ncbi:MAG: type I methionyl aminopeptidase [Candidatus Peribacteraceae bacterium]|jgi:methionyl aminopeptidase|nr:type I methionyl aminopeptidase [Candidatus Peribacteraceae bacterium]MDP7454127.1 type I methionyl aminopeptidase [Candidatus Peribacteraceae bacterium]MDP7646248.1 type I methionyl aminopeptidase [Candidatus Peribacteraceae bacterium]|tara:strand:+ start:236 stop:982 length:747 start_codon:yes stop_codon:yes gene_type:complete
MSKFQIFSEQEIDSLRKGGKILRSCLNLVEGMVGPGVTTLELDRAAEKFIRDQGAVPGFKGYRNFPSTLCTSANEQCVHGIPGERQLKEGDIISVDCGVIYDGLYTDACFTAAVGEISSDARKLMSVTKLCLEKVVELLREGVRVGDVSALVQETAEAEGFHPVKALTGHGLGKNLHQFPDIPNLGDAGTGPKIPAGTLLAIEPIISAGSDSVEAGDDAWTLSTTDKALCAHFEHTLLIETDGCEIIA